MADDILVNEEYEYGFYDDKGKKIKNSITMCDMRTTKRLLE